MAQKVKKKIETVKDIDKVIVNGDQKSGQIVIEAVEVTIPHSMPALNLKSLTYPAVRIRIGSAQLILKYENAESLGYMLLQMLAKWHKKIYGK